MKPHAISFSWFGLVLSLGLLLPSLTTRAAIHYVDATSAAPVPPYLSWATAAAVIQDAVDAAVSGDEVLVTNGVYATGGRAVGSIITNRVAVDRPIFLHSVNGTQSTMITGYHIPGDINGNAAIRCIYLTNGAVVSGFTLTNGATGWFGSPPYDASSGGGIWSETNGVVSNCVIIANSASDFGGGAHGGTLINCLIQGNRSYNGGGAHNSTLLNCVIISNTAVNLSGSGGGGGVSGGGTLNSCAIVGNSSWSDGGGVYQGQNMTLDNCLILSNSCHATGGGISGFSSFGFVSINNCTIVGNVATQWAGGIWLTNGSVNNCISYYNSAPGPAPDGNDFVQGGGNNSCTPNPNFGTGSFTNEPIFVDLAGGNLRLQSNSPCINAGNNAYVVDSTDLDGHPRIIGGTVDMGAYEFVPPVSMRIARMTSSITLSWPLWASNFVAQQVDGLPVSSGGWSNVAATVTQSTDENVVTVPSTNAARFFRLFLP